MTLMSDRGKGKSRKDGIERKLESLFYNPKNDSVETLLRLIRKTHDGVAAITDPQKARLLLDQYNYLDLVQNSSIPERMASTSKANRLILELFEGVVRWHSPRAMYNLTPPPLLHTVAATSIAMLYNPNLVWDIPSGKIALAEQRVVKEVAEYTGWDWKVAGGVFTFGGKATDMYGIKVGLKRVGGFVF